MSIHQRIHKLWTGKHLTMLYTAAPLSWGDLVALARSNHVLGIHWITRLRDEAQDLAAKRYADWQAQRAIASVAQNAIDVWEYPDDARMYLEELDALIFGDEA